MINIFTTEVPTVQRREEVGMGRFNLEGAPEQSALARGAFSHPEIH